MYVCLYVWAVHSSEDHGVCLFVLDSAAPNSLERQVGTATYLIDFLALRVGGEKDTG